MYVLGYYWNMWICLRVCAFIEFPNECLMSHSFKKTNVKSLQLKETLFSALQEYYKWIELIMSMIA